MNPLKLTVAQVVVCSYLPTTTSEITALRLFPMHALSHSDHQRGRAFTVLSGLHVRAIVRSLDLVPAWPEGRSGGPSLRWELTTLGLEALALYDVEAARAQLADEVRRVALFGPRARARHYRAPGLRAAR